jgi:hypothetical protein
MSERCTRCGGPNDIFNYCPAGLHGEPCVGAQKNETAKQNQEALYGSQCGRDHLGDVNKKVRNGLTAIREICRSEAPGEIEAIVDGLLGLIGEVDPAGTTPPTMQLWIVGQYKGECETGDGTTAWEFQGVFASEAAADKACRDETYFYAGPYALGEELPHETRDVEAVFPRVMIDDEEEEY